MRLNQSKGILALAKKIDCLRGSYETANIISLLRDCGLNEDEIATYMAVTSKLGHYEDRIKSQGTGYDGVRALVRADDETIAQAMNLSNAGGPLGANEIALLRDIPERSKIPDIAIIHKLRDECVQAECVRMARERQQSFTASVRQLHIALEGYAERLRYVRHYYETVEDYNFFADVSDEEIEALRQEGVKVRAIEETFFGEKEEDIIALAKILLKEFDEIFPGRDIPKSNWGLAGIGNPTLRYFAEARQALVALQTGGFLGGFPSEASNYGQWDALSSIAYLAGVHNGSMLSQRLSPRPVEKLNAFIVRAASGVEALGLDAAGFRIHATYISIRRGRPRRAKVVLCKCTSMPELRFEPRDHKKLGRRIMNAWNQRCVLIDGDGFASDLSGQIDRLGKHDVHLLAATLRDEPFKERGKGEDDKRQQFGHAFQLLRDIRPKAFFFETSAEFRGPKHLPFRNRLARQADDLGYAITDFELDALSFGVPQKRPRSILLGVAKEYGSQLRQPILANPIRQTVGDTIADVAFGFLPKIEAIPEEARTPDQIKYRKWARAWLSEHGDKSVPDTLSLIRDNSDRFDKWHKFGFNETVSHIVQPRFEDLHTDSVPLSLPILKRLQGVPDDWLFFGSHDEQRAQICETTPPVIYRAVGHVIHAALTGEDVDLDQAARQKLASGRWKNPSGFGSMAQSHDPARRRALEWREHILREEEGP
ncbi:hypothetical protein BJF91_02285 [Allorhizobium taibaishanense]|nr:hypothetical protein BJF91_02285 [Allorhizobium taibaishanense]